MGSTVLFVLISSFIVTCACYKAGQQQQCYGENEELSCAPSCPPERTCENRNIEFDCLATNERCNLKCICKPGYYRNAAIGACMSSDDCDRCPGDKDLFSYGLAGDNNCADNYSPNY